MSQICVQVQKQEEKLSTIVRRCIGKYRKIENSLSGDSHEIGWTGKDRCVLGAILSEVGWDGICSTFLASNAGRRIFHDIPLQIRVNIVNMNNSTTENNWAEIADYLDNEGL
jgi:hypothetical protein